MVGVTAAGSHTATKLITTLAAIPQTNPAAALVSLGVIVLVLGIRRVTRRVPGALIAVVGAIALSRTVNLAGRGVHVLGAVPSGLPHLSIPSLALSDLTVLLPTAVSMFVVIVAQSAATSRAEQCLKPVMSKINGGSYPPDHPEVLKQDRRSNAGREGTTHGHRSPRARRTGCAHWERRAG
ncbi:MAG: hypothetical protein DLM60_09850 [Pseudonocardiales bacterium]|nr:MAG: hypothetical protein DLM60_09850 [Pseudonocardiales bacterium]